MTAESRQPAAQPALKEIFNLARIRHIARETACVYPPFDQRRFIASSCQGLSELSILQRMRRLAECLHDTLPDKFPAALRILYDLAPRLNSTFVTMVLPEYVALYGAHDFDVSLEALRYFTVFGSSEFAIRVFLRRDLKRTLKAMRRWSKDANEHVRRLSSEGSRPRLPWSFRLDAIVQDPSLTMPILENLRCDDASYVRKSVANHLNDFSKDHPAWLLDRLESWPLDDLRTAWIAKHALRSLIKKGDKRALAVVGAGAAPQVRVRDFRIEPRSIHLGDTIALSFRLESAAQSGQRLVIDYRVHYVKKSGGRSAKVFKLKSLTLPAGAEIKLSCAQTIRNFTTRVHYAGRHDIDLLINGESLAHGFFELQL